MSVSVPRLKQTYNEIEFYGAENYGMFLFVPLITQPIFLCICVSLLFDSGINIGVTW